MPLLNSISISGILSLVAVLPYFHYLFVCLLNVLNSNLSKKKANVDRNLSAFVICLLRSNYVFTDCRGWLSLQTGFELPYEKSPFGCLLLLSQTLSNSPSQFPNRLLLLLGLNLTLPVKAPKTQNSTATPWVRIPWKTVCSDFGAPTRHAAHRNIKTQSIPP